MLTIPRDQPLALTGWEGGAETVFMDGEGGWGTYYDLGQVIREHPESDWDGHTITASSEGGVDGRSFTITYRLCRDSCESAAFQRPLAYIVEAASETWLCWEWEGNEADIDGFMVSFHDMSREGAYFAVPVREPGRRCMLLSDISSTWPCGNSFAFRVAAYRGAQESPYSNEAVWNSPECPITVQVTFETIRTDGELPLTNRIFGRFLARGSSGFGLLPFRTYRRFLAPNSTYSIMGHIFEPTNSALEVYGAERCNCYAPTTNSVIVGLEPDDTLNFSADSSSMSTPWHNRSPIRC